MSAAASHPRSGCTSQPKFAHAHRWLAIPPTTPLLSLDLPRVAPLQSRAPQTLPRTSATKAGVSQAHDALTLPFFRSPASDSGQVPSTDGPAVRRCIALPRGRLGITG